VFEYDCKQMNLSKPKYASVCVCVRTHAHVCMCICLYVCMYVCMYVCVCVYTYKYTLQAFCSYNINFWSMPRQIQSVVKALGF